MTASHHLASVLNFVWMWLEAGVILGNEILVYLVPNFKVYNCCTVVLQSSLEILMDFYIFLKFLYLQYLFFKVTGVRVCQY